MLICFFKTQMIMKNKKTRRMKKRNIKKKKNFKFIM